MTDSQAEEKSFTTRLMDTVRAERFFILAIGVTFLVAGGTYPYPDVARWVGFLIAAYAVVGNDSIQTIGTFIASNERQPWWHLWLFIGGIFLVTVAYSWVSYGGDVSYERLSSKGFEEAPATFTFLQVGAPIFLLILTRLRMPVSTTFLLLSSFATNVKSIGAVLTKSVSGYIVSFLVAILLWMALAKQFERWFADDEPHAAWGPALWISSGALWSFWVMQDAANIAVYLPRSLSTAEFIAFGGVMFAGLGLLFWLRGERVQEVVNEKSNVVDVRAATVINVVYAVIIYTFKEVSKVPMSTTWVFIGLLGGREMALSIMKTSRRDLKSVVRLLGRDLLFVTIGLIVSLIIAAAVNPLVNYELQKFFGLV